MQLQKIEAISHPDGLRIDLRWINPSPTEFPGVQVVRREDGFPETPGDGNIIFSEAAPDMQFDDLGLAHLVVSDSGLLPFRRYYYALFPFSTGPVTFSIEPANRAAALATTTFGSARLMQSLLPAIYDRYDTAIGGVGAGPLNRLLGLLGGEMDLLRTYAEALKQLYEIDNVDGRLLPLLGQWIGWKTDFRSGINSQRNEIRNAPAIYQRNGLVPTLGATIKRVTNWESRTKEYFNNVARSNQPQRLNLWAEMVSPAPVDPPRVLSVDESFDGRPSQATDELGVNWLFYHTRRKNRSQLWYKTSPVFYLTAEAMPALEALDVPALQPFFLEIELPLAAGASLVVINNRWQIADATNNVSYVIEAEEEQLVVYETSSGLLNFAPSKPLIEGLPHQEIRDPAVVVQNNALWVFWSVLDRTTSRWEIQYQVRRAGAWLTAPELFTHGVAGVVPDRRRPSATLDDAGGLWLFWEEHRRGRWQVRYNRYPETGLAANPPDPTAWDLAAPADFPLDGSEQPRVESSFFVYFNPDPGAEPLWICWARRNLIVSPPHTRWTVAVRSKGSIDPTLADWSTINTLAKPDPEVNDRDPSLAFFDGDLRLVWSADRNGHYGVWMAIVQAGNTINPDAITSPPFDQRHPLLLQAPGTAAMLYRSNAAITYESRVFGATQTRDLRYSGTVTTPVRNTHRIDLQGVFEDFQTYTYDTGPNNQPANNDRFSRDTVGLFVTPDTADPVVIQRALDRVRGILPEFMATTNRTIFEAE